MAKESVAIPLKQYIQVQGIEVQSPLNVHGTREEFKTGEPNTNQLWLHYIHCGRAEEMASIHSDLNVWATGQRLGLDPKTLSLEQMEQELQTTFNVWEEYQKHNH